MTGDETPREVNIYPEGTMNLRSNFHGYFSIDVETLALKRIMVVQEKQLADLQSHLDLFF